MSFSDAWGGLEMSTVKYARLFRDAGFRSYGICRDQKPIHSHLHQLGIPCLTLSPSNYFSPSNTLAIRRFIRRTSISHIFIHSLKDLWILVPAVWGLSEVKLIGFARMFFKNISKKDPLHRHLYRRLYRLIALSEVQAGYLLDCLPLNREQVIVIPNGVDLIKFHPRPYSSVVRQGLGALDEDFLFGLIGRLDRQKGSLEFVEAAAQVSIRHPRAKFAMVGGNTIGDDPFLDQVLKKIEKLNLGDRIRLTNHRQDIPEVLNALDAFVMPSYEENFANVLLEALASGLPCISTNAGGTPEILNNGSAGLLCEPRSADALAQAMLLLIEQPQMREGLRQKARHRAESTYDMHLVLDKVLQAANLS